MDDHAKQRSNPARRRLQAGIASNYIEHAPDWLQPDDKVILACRVSSTPQSNSRNLDDQDSNLRRFTVDLGGVAVDSVHRIRSGTDPSWLFAAVAKAHQHGAKFILAESTDRFIRHPLYHSVHNPDAQARTLDLELLKWCTEGVILLTVLHPDATPSDVRSYQSQRGQQAKGKKGGRPKKQPRGRYQQRATITEIERIVPLIDRYSVRQIAKIIGRPVSTTQGLITKARALKSLV